MGTRVYKRRSPRQGVFWLYLALLESAQQARDFLTGMSSWMRLGTAFLGEPVGVGCQLFSFVCH